MRVAFLHAQQSPRYANAMVASVQETMPGVEILQLTDETTPLVVGAKAIRMKWDHPNPMIFKMEHLSQLEGDVLALDTDVIVQRDLRQVFALEFDMALTFRNGPIIAPDGEDITKRMPINCGVMFQRNRMFWHACLNWCVGTNPGWYADQLAVAANAGKFNVLKLHCDNFNYTPYKPGEDLSRRYAVHYKGNSRKYLDERLGLVAA